MHDLGEVELPDGLLQKKMEAWKQKALFNDRSYASWLKEQPFDEETFAKVITLTEQPDWDKAYRFRDEDKPAWMRRIDEAFALHRQTPPKQAGPLHFSIAFRPFILWARQKLQQFYEQNKGLEELTDWPSLTHSIVEHLAGTLVQVGARTIVLELHVAKQMQELSGDTPEERYQSFVRTKLMDPDALEFIYKEYPVLTRQLMLRTHYFVIAMTEALSRYIADAEMLGERLLHGQERLISMSAGLGDAHQQGRTVMRFHFTGDKTLLYKPKSLTMAKHYFELLEWFNEKGFRPEFRGHQIIDRPHYAWEAFVCHQACHSEEELQRYYKRLGGLLAVLHSLCGLDFHYENIVANGEHPVIVDLETIFHQKTDIMLDQTAEVTANYRIVHSVLGMGLLPTLVTTTPDKVGFDIGGMSAVEQETPIPVLRVENEGTDEMRYVRKKDRSVVDGNNIPKLNGKPAHVADYVEELLEGFSEAFTLVMKHKKELLDDHGPIASFEQDSIRKLVRVTQYYADFLMESQHPDYLRDALDSEQLLDRLWFTILDPRQIAFEKRDLIEGDFPYFTTMPGTRDLFASKGERIPNYFQQSGLDVVRERISQLSDAYIKEQKEWIEASLVNYSPERIQVVEYDPAQDSRAADTNAMIQEAVKIGHDWIDKAIYGAHNDVTWIGLSMNYHNQWQVSSLDRGLYNGLSGMALFYAYLYQVTNKEEFKQTAIQVGETLRLTRVLPTDFTSAFHGSAAIVYTLAHLSALFGDRKEWTNCMISNMENIAAKVTDDHYYDVLGGAAGIIPAMIAAYHQTGDELALHTAEQYGFHLLEQAVDTGSGWGWAATGQRKPLGGFAHGAAGIASSLHLLYLTTGKDAYRSGAMQALEYDRSLFSTEGQGWVDVRHGKVTSAEAWCHGAAGIGISRVMMLQEAQDAAGLKDEIERAMKLTLRKGMGRSHSLCHGDLGNAELFLNAGMKMNRPDWIQQAQSIAMKVIQEKHQMGKFRTGVPRSLAMPGLMLGLSGIGYQLLRMAKPAIVPSVLTLEGSR